MDHTRSTSSEPPPDARSEERALFEPLADRFGRTFDYVRIAVNERCNLRCMYCMPPEGIPFREGDELLTRDELLRVVAALGRAGVGKVRLTGGEPLLRPDLAGIVEDAMSTDGVESVHVTTNGVLFEKKAAALKRAGLSGVNISLDTLDAAKFLTITRRTGIERVLGAIRCAIDAEFDSVKVNVVALRGFNDDEVAAFADFTKNDPVTVRFIELMPFDSHQVWRRGHFFSADWIVKRLREYAPVVADTGSRTEHHVFRFEGHRGKVAVIPAYTRSLCAECNRVRVTANGRIRNCLYAKRESDLLGPLRRGASAEEIIAIFRAAVHAKAVDGWAAQRDSEAPVTDDDRASMTQIGG